MREIKFKAKTSDGEWVEGDLIHGVGSCHGNMYILPIRHIYPKWCNDLNGWNVVPESVSQFTGLTDKNGKEIYEGDVLKYTIGVPYEEVDDISGTVVWSIEDARYMLINDEEYINEEFDIDTCTNSEVIGNIHDK